MVPDGGEGYGGRHHREGVWGPHGPWNPVGDLGFLRCWGLGETDGNRDRGSLRLVLQPQAVEWGWGIGSGSPSSLLHWGYTDGERECHPAPPRPLNPGFLVSALSSGLTDPVCVVFCWNGICFLIRALCKTSSMFHFYINGLISNNIIFNNG